MLSKQKQKLQKRKRRHSRVRAKISGSAEVPRVSVFRSSRHIYAQAIDDASSKTVFSANDAKIKEKNKTKKAAKVGENLGELMKKNGVKKALFDRGGFSYHGRVKAVAEGLRSAGIKI